MAKAILIILTLAGFAAGAEFEVNDRLSVDGSSLFRSTLTVTGAGIEVRSGTSTAYSLAVGTSTNYSLTLSTGGNLQVSGTIYQGTYTVLNSSMLDSFTLKLDTTTNKIKLADRIEQNIMLDAFKIAVSSSLSIFNMVDGIMDEFEDESGVDTVGSTNESYNSTDDYYSPTKEITGGIDTYNKLLLHNNGMDGDTSVTDSETTSKPVTNPADQYDSYTKLMLHGDGTDGSASPTDSKGKAITNTETYDTYTKLMIHFEGTGATFADSAASKGITANGNATQATSQYKFGTKSGYFDGTGDYLSLATNTDWDWGTDAFTIDCWIYPTNLVGGVDRRCIASNQYNQSGKNGNWDFSVYPTGYIGFALYDGTTYLGGFYSADGAVVINTWQHVALVRNGNTFKVYVNGSQVATTTTITDSL